MNNYQNVHQVSHIPVFSVSAGSLFKLLQLIYTPGETYSE